MHRQAKCIAPDSRFNFRLMPAVTISRDMLAEVQRASFSVCDGDAAGHVLGWQDLGREALRLWLALPTAGAVVGMNACSRMCHSPRRCRDSSLRPRVMAAQFVRPFPKLVQFEVHHADVLPRTTGSLTRRELPPRKRPVATGKNGSVSAGRSLPGAHRDRKGSPQPSRDIPG